MLPIQILDTHSVKSIEPKPDYQGGERTDSQATDVNGIPLYVARVKVFFEDEDGDPTNQTLRITFPSKTAPYIEGDKANFPGLVAGVANGAIYLRANGIESFDGGLDGLLEDEDGDK